MPTNPPTTENRNLTTLTTISLQYASLVQKGHCPLGMYVVPSATDPLHWDAVLFIHQGYYEDAVLKFQITFPSDYPVHPPTVQFVTDIFHPLISNNDGNFNFHAGGFRPWQPKIHNIFGILHFVKASFDKETLDTISEHDCPNKEAFRLCHQSLPSFAALAKQSASLSISSSALYDKDHPSMTGKATDGIIFEELEQDQLQEWRTKLGLQSWDYEDQADKGSHKV